MTDTAMDFLHKANGSGRGDGGGEQFVTMTIAGQLFGIPVRAVHDVLAPQRVTPIPLAPREVAGALNLRGRIVTIVDMRLSLNLEPREEGQARMYVVVEHQNELYSLMIDRVDEVLTVPMDRYERNPETLDARWCAVSAGIYRLDDKLLVALDVESLLNLDRQAAA